MAEDNAAFVAAEQALWSRFGITPTERQVVLPAGNEVRLQEVGDGPPILFIHGAAVAGSSWVLLADALEDDFRCILVDRPGCGLSDPVPGGPLTLAGRQFKRFAEAARARPSSTGSGSTPPRSLCTSLGGFFGFRAAMAATRNGSPSWSSTRGPMGTPMATVPTMMRFGSLRSDEGAHDPAPDHRAPAVRIDAQTGRPEVGPSSRAQFDDAHAGVDRLAAPQAHRHPPRSETDNNTFVSFQGEDPAFLFADDELRQLELPVLLLWGDEDPNGGRIEAEAFASRLPNVTLDVIERAGHAPWIDELAHCASRTRTFLTS